MPYSNEPPPLRSVTCCLLVPVLMWWALQSLHCWVYKTVSFMCYLFINYFIHSALDSLVWWCYSTLPASPYKSLHHLPPTPQATHILISWPNEAGALSAKSNQWESARMLSLFLPSHFSHQKFIYLFIFLLGLSLCLSSFLCVLLHFVSADVQMGAHAEPHNKLSVLCFSTVR